MEPKREADALRPEADRPWPQADLSFAAEALAAFLLMGVCPAGYDREDLAEFVARLTRLAAPPAGVTPPRAPEPPDEEIGWVIEKHINSELHYWVGRGTNADYWSRDHADAVRFARQQDAATVLAWLLSGEGRAVQHLWRVAARPLAPSGPQKQNGDWPPFRDDGKTPNRPHEFDKDPETGFCVICGWSDSVHFPLAPSGLGQEWVSKVTRDKLDEPCVLGAGVVTPESPKWLRPCPSCGEMEWHSDQAGRTRCDHCLAFSPFHWHDGFTFQRQQSGAVLVSSGQVELLLIPAEEWSSIVAAMRSSARPLAPSGTPHWSHATMQEFVNEVQQHLSAGRTSAAARMFDRGSVSGTPAEETDADEVTRLRGVVTEIARARKDWKRRAEKAEAAHAALRVRLDGLPRYSMRWSHGEGAEGALARADGRWVKLDDLLAALREEQETTT